MCSLPAISGQEALRAFLRAGFIEVRIKGSHHILKKPGHPKRLTVPVHGNRGIKNGTLRGLISQSGLSVEEFREYLR